MSKRSYKKSERVDPTGEAIHRDLGSVAVRGGAAAAEPPRLRYSRGLSARVLATAIVTRR